MIKGITTIKNYQTFIEYNFNCDAYLNTMLIEHIQENNGVSELIVSDIGNNKNEIVENLRKILKGKIYKYDINISEKKGNVNKWATIIMQNLRNEKELINKAIELIKYDK
ncbi:MAG: hypothetical protein DRI95_00730 [Bacteroidetes bacterium]|nr:MAG: hypothetical protein DRI95_00730 [Bacteroidota bacterium]